VITDPFFVLITAFGMTPLLVLSEVNALTDLLGTYNERNQRVKRLSALSRQSNIAALLYT
jgi:hypothetical protein